MTELPDRRAEILRIIVSDYIASANPVASEMIARVYSLGVSPATIRHEMARLEEEGYISRPHTSAGGIPSDKGYRYYVQWLVRQARLDTDDQLAIRRFFDESEQEPEAWARLAVSILTQKLDNFAIATVPRTQTCHFRYINLVALQDLLVLLVLVLQEGKVKKRLLQTAEPASQDELMVCANKLNSLYNGFDYRNIKAKKFALSLLEQDLTDAVTEIMEAEDRHRYDQYYLDGWRHLVSHIEFMEGKRMLSLAEALEERSVLVSLLASVQDGSGLRVTIGDENAVEAFQECSVILSNYGVDDLRGAIGIIGPTRMPYGKAISMIDCISAVMSDLLKRLPA